MSIVEIKVGQKWIATKDVAFWKTGTIVEITGTGDCIRFKNSDGEEEFIFNNPEDVVWFKSIYQLVVTDQVNEKMGTVESLRNSILGIRSKREALQKEILQLDEQEKEAVEKLKEQGFVLYEDNVSKELDAKEPVSAENKTVLYAEDIEEDMTDCRNWEVGDLLQIVKPSYSFDVKHELVEIKLIVEAGWLLCRPLTNYPDARGKDWTYLYDEVSFHSRPVK